MISTYSAYTFDVHMSDVYKENVDSKHHFDSSFTALDNKM